MPPKKSPSPNSARPGPKKEKVVSPPKGFRWVRGATQATGKGEKRSTMKQREIRGGGKDTTVRPTQQKIIKDVKDTAVPNTPSKNQKQQKVVRNEPYLPQFDAAQASFDGMLELERAIVEHITLAKQLLTRHTEVLKRHFEWANPVKCAYFYCTAVEYSGVACTYASATEKDVQEHIRARHPGSGAVPRRFGLSRFQGGMANIGPSCSVTAAVAAIATISETDAGFRQHDLLRKEFRTSSAEDSRNLLQAPGLRLPTAPGAVLEALAAQDADIARLFAVTECQDTACKQCGTTIEGPREQSPAILTYVAPPGPPRNGTAKALEAAFGPDSTDQVQPCSVCGGQLQPAVAITYYLFQGAVAVTVVPPESTPDTQGLPDLPLEVCFVTRPLAATPFLLHAVLCATSLTHVVAYVAERVGETITWHLYNGTVHQAGVKAPNPKTMDTMIFLPAPPPPPSDPEGNEEEGQRTVARNANQQPPPPPLRPRDAKGRPLYGWEGSDAAEDEDDEGEQDTEEEQDQPSPNTPENEDGDDEAEPTAEDPAGDTALGDENEIVDPPQEEFVHGKTIRPAKKMGLDCPLCTHHWTAIARRHQQTEHANHQHLRETCSVVALERARLDRCRRCGQFVVASDRGRKAHATQCGQFKTRAMRNHKRTRLDAPTPDDAMPGALATPSPAAQRPRPRDPPTEEDQEWVRTLPSTIRTLRKQEWGLWTEAVGQTLLGYTAAGQADRCRRQLALTTLVRSRLAKPGQDSEEKQQDEPPPPTTVEGGAARNTDEELPTAESHTPEERRRRRILHQLSLGALGKAARTLFSAQLPRARASDVIEQLQTLHPQEDPADYPLPPVAPYPYDLKPEKVKKVVVQRLGRAAAPGLDGWTRELLVPVVENKNLLQEMTTLLQDILAGRVSPSFGFRLRACVVHPFLKEAGSTKVRPITPESVWLKMASHLAVDAVDKSFREVFKGWQFGVWGDAAEAVRQIRTSYASVSADTLVALDATNAYNRMSRRHVLTALYGHQELRPTFGVVNLALGEAGSLGVYEDGVRTQELASTKGVRQGMVLGPLLFATAMAEVLRPVLTRHPAAKVSAYLDDLTIAGPRAAVQGFLDEAGPLLAEVGFDINPTKSHHLSKQVAPEPVTVAGTVVPVAAGVVRILGAGFVGNGAPVEEWVRAKVDDYESYFAALEDDLLPRHARLNLLRVSALPRLTYLLRTHSPAELERGATWFDDRVLRVLSALLGGTVLDEKALLLARLPMSMGGLGLRAQSPIAKFAVSCVGRKSAQRDQSSVVDAEVARTLISLLTEPALAILKANTAPGATRVLVDPAVHLSDFAFEVLIRQRLMLRVLRPGTKCVCGADADNAHVNVCPSLPGGPRIARHNRVVTAIDAWAKQLGLSVATEPRAGTENRERLDVTIAAAGGTFATDVVITYPGRSRSDAQSPLQQSHGDKKRKWANWAHDCGAFFAPVSLESTGGLHRESFQWMMAVAGSTPFPYSAQTALSELLSAVCQAVHEGNALMFSRVQHTWARMLLRGGC